MSRLLTTTLLGLLLVSVGFNLYQWYFPRIEKVPGTTVYLPGKKEATTVHDLPQGNQSATVKVVREYVERTQNARDLLAKVKNIPDLENEKKITALMEAKMKLELSLSEKDLALNDLATQKKVWQDKYNKVSVDNANNTASVVSEVSPKIATTEKREHFYTPKENYTIITSENPSVKFYGVESYEFKNPRHKDILQLNLKVQGLYLNKILIPYGGAELLFNPDGKLKPVAGYGYFYDNNSGRFYPYWMGGLQYNLIRL